MDDRGTFFVNPTSTVAAEPREIVDAVLASPRARLHRAVGLVLVLAAAVPLAVAAALAALGSPAGPEEARLVDAAFAALRPFVEAPVPVGVDQHAARLQLSWYAALTGAFERHAQVLTGARELALVAATALLVAVVALARSLGVRPPAVAAVLLGMAVCPPAVTALTTAGPGLFGAAWTTVGAALLARDRPWQLVLGAPAVLAGVITAPVLAVPVFVVGAAVSVALHRRHGTVLLAVAVIGTALPLALLPAPTGPAAVPTLVAATVVIALVLLDEAGTLLARRSRSVRRAAVGAAVAVAVAAAAVVLVPAPAALSGVRAEVGGAPGVAAWLAEATDPTTGVAAAPGVWADLVRVGVPVARLAGGALAVGVVTPDEDAVLARFGQGAAALVVAAPDGPAQGSAASAALLADDANLSAPDEVRALLRAGAVDPRTVAVLAGLAARAPVTVADLPAVSGEEPAVPRHRAVVADVDADVRAWLATQRQPPILAAYSDGPAAELTWPLPAAAG